jgi:tRNA-binding protein
MKAPTTYDTFHQLDVRVGTILSAVPFEKAKKPAYQLEIDFGSTIGIKKSSAQITTHYQPTQLVGRQVVAVINFPVKQIANFFSECLVLGVYDSNDAVVLLQPDQPLPNGSIIG